MKTVGCHGKEGIGDEVTAFARKLSAVTQRSERLGVCGLLQGDARDS